MKKNVCVICGINVRTNVDQTCGNPECRKAAHDKFHKMIQETQGTIEGINFI